MADTGGSEFFQVYLQVVNYSEADRLTERLNQILKAISDAGGTVVDRNIDISGSNLVARIVYTLPKGATLATS